jgi:membrane protein CcdC involved in cytochrome C biogenesis
VQKSGKAIMAFLYAVAFIVIPLVTGDRHVDPVEGVTIAIAVCTNAGVYLIPLFPGTRWTKTALGALLAGLQIAAVVILDHAIDANEALMIAAAVLGALGIAAAPAASKPSPAAVASGARPAAVGWGMS